MKRTGIPALLVVVWLAAARSLPAQSPPPTPTPPALPLPSFEPQLRAVRAGLHVSSEGLTGEAAPALRKAIDEARYVLIGEDHLTQEIPRFAGAVADLMAAQGLSALAVETGPQVAAFVQASREEPDRIERMRALQRKYPASVGLLNAVEENDLAAHVAKAAHQPGFRIWGLDQEFLGSGGWLLDQILATRPGAEATVALRRLQTQEQRAATQAREAGDASKLFLLTADDAELAAAGALLQRGGNPTANALFRELVVSHEIYRKNEQDPPESNAQRARLLKEHFRRNFEAAEAAGEKGKFLLKFGDWHVYKGFNPLHQCDLGNYVAELADGRGERSLHLCVLGAQGTRRLSGGYARPSREEPFVMTEDPDYRWIKPAVDNQVPGAWTAYDLRRLRHRQFRDLDPDMARCIDGLDWLVIVPELTPASLVP